MSPLRLITVLFLLVLSSTAQAFDVFDGMATLEYLLKLARENPEEPFAKEEIYHKGNALFVTGDTAIAITSNSAAEAINNGEYEKAQELIENNLTKASLFFPFRYNLGVAYLHMNDLRRARLHFIKASQVAPAYSRTYLQIGFIHERWHQDSVAIEWFRQALEKNSKELDTFVRIGDIYFKRNQVEMASRYYKASLEINHRFPNGLIGLAKVEFRKEQYHRALVLLRSIDTSGEYNKALHYYYGESSYKLKDYKTAYEQYDMLLKNPEDPFFLLYSPALIRHKRDLAQQLIRD